MRKALPALLFLGLLVPAAHADELVGHAINFRLIDHADQSWELYRFPEAQLVVLGAHACDSATVDAGAAAWDELAVKYPAPDLRFFFLNAAMTDDRVATAAWAHAHETTTPILKDTVQAVSRQLGLRNTGDVVLVRPADDWAVVWRGSLSDAAALGDAIESILAGDPTPASATATAGEAIVFAQESTVEYARDIAPILEARCVSCHLPGGTGPFAMNNYKKVKGWSEMIAEVILTKRMPPWHADPAYGHFVNDMSMTPEEERMLLSWIQAGSPKHAREPDPLADLAPAAEAGWALGTPDTVLEMPEAFDLPATGVVDYQYIHVPTGLTEDKWVRALEVKPGNLKVVHHALIFVLYPPEYRHIQPRPGEGLNGYFASYLPGAAVRPFPEDTGQFLPAGSTFVFQMHYTTTGKEERDQTQMALYFHDTPPAEALEITAVAESDLYIPPMDRDHEVKKSERFKAGTKVWGLSPHMHYRGSRFRFSVDGKGDAAPTTLLNIPYYEFDWQPMYLLKEPVEIPEKGRIQVVGAFDNSPTNPRNPNPNKLVMFGRQSFEEMFIGYVMSSSPRDDARYTPREIEPDEREAREGPALNAETLVGTKWRMGPFRMQFMENGRLLSTWFAGSWHIEGDRVHVVTNDNRTLTSTIQGSRLYFNGQPLRQFE